MLQLRDDQLLVAYTPRDDEREPIMLLISVEDLLKCHNFFDKIHEEFSKDKKGCYDIADYFSMQLDRVDFECVMVNQNGTKRVYFD